MRVLIVSHAYVERSNHKKLELLNGSKDLEIGVVYPKRWRTWHGEEKVQKSQPRAGPPLAEKFKVQSSYDEFPLDTYFNSDAGEYHYNTIQLIIAIIRFKPDLIHVEEEPFSVVSCQLSVVSWLLRVKFTFFSWENITGLRLGLMRSIFEKIVFWRATAVLAGTNGAKERLEKRGFNKRIEVISQFGVDLDTFSPSQPQQGETLWRPVIIGFVGRPTFDKGIDVLLEAFSRLPDKYRLLWVTSSASIPQIIDDQIRISGIDDRVRVETNVPQEKLAEYYRQMDIYVLPSRTTPTWKEQFGRTLIEAMAYGLPVVGSSSGAIPEVIGEAGLIFAEGETEDLRNKIIKLEDDFLYKQFQKEGRQHVERFYSMETIAKRIHQFFIRLI